MKFIKFGKEYRLGIKEIDNQHKEIYQTINLLYEIKDGNKKNISNTFKNLLVQLKNHFIYEENYMAEKNDFHLFSHKLEHQRALAKYSGYFDLYKKGKEKFDEEILFSLRLWIKNHFEFKDSKI